MMKCDSTGCTTTLNRHVDKYRKANGQTSQAQLHFQLNDVKSSEVALGNFKYNHVKMKKILFLIIFW